MTLSSNRTDREYAKFVENVDGKTAVRVVADDQLSVTQALAKLIKQNAKLLEAIQLQSGTNGSRGVLKDGAGTGSRVKVTSRGQLVTAPLDFTKMYPAEVSLDNTAFTVIPPIMGKQFVITVIDLYADKNVGPNDATVELYEADSETSLIPLHCIYKKQMPKYKDIGLTGLNIIIEQGSWVNIKTDDNDIFANIGGYYIDAK